MTGAQINSLINLYCNTTDTGFTQANKLVLVNNVKNEIASRISQKDSSYFIVPSTDNIVVNQREYSFPDDVLNHLILVEAAFVTDTPLKYKILAPYNISNWVGSGKGLTEAEITAEFSNDDPRYFIRRRAIYILSGAIIAVTSGLRITYRAFPADLANMTGTTDLGVDPTSTTFGIPRQFHELIARRVSIIFKQSRPIAIPLSPYEQNYEIDLEKELKAISREDFSDGFYASTPNEGNHGADF